MAFKAGIIFITLVLGCLAIPTPKSIGLSRFFDSEDFEASPDSRIVGGSVAAAGSHPWMAGLLVGDTVRSLYCGGSVLSQRTVLTAAHCLDDFYSFGTLSSSLRVIVGTNRWNRGGQTLALTSNATHPHYVSWTLKNDIAMLYTASNIIFNNQVRPVTLNFNYIGGGVQARAVGWGRTSRFGPGSPQLLELQMPTIDGQRCVRDVRQAKIDLNMGFVPPVDPHIELCTFHSRGHGMCQGDSGSPLVRADDGTQIGIVSWIFHCAVGAPDMFVRISAFQSWINQHIR
ncbi:hypothetical protein ABMA27_003807 [Loxostege sticticalis]|uniref:Peptidase S1 domain-containing protein n=1 Tax=Loxostege sticticalis TaxID=481309 RepID=A0ABR3HQC3_LOXSC